MTPSALVADTLTFIQTRTGHLLLHAGGSAGTDGRTVVVHGVSGAGKTTLTAALVQAGLAYVTDETVCLDPDTLVIEPFPKPLTVKPGSQELLAHLAPPPDEISEGSGNWQLPPTGSAAHHCQTPSFAPPSSSSLTWTPTAPTSSSPPSPLGAPPSSSVSSRARCGRSSRVRSPRSRDSSPPSPHSRCPTRNAFDAASVIINELMDAPPPVGLEAPPATAGPAPTGTAGHRRADGVDWILLAGEAVLFDGEHLHHLDGPGAAIWLALDGETDLAGVAAELAEHYGADAEAVLLDVEDLVRILGARRLATPPDA